MSANVRYYRLIASEKLVRTTEYQLILNILNSSRKANAENSRMIINIILNCLAVLYHTQADNFLSAPHMPTSN